jgi:hypothetical protein
VGKTLRRIGNLLHLEEKHSRLRNSTFMPWNEKLSLKDLINRNTCYGDAEKYPVRI